MKALILSPLTLSLCLSDLEPLFPKLEPAEHPGCPVQPQDDMAGAAAAGDHPPLPVAESYLSPTASWNRSS